jgi:hypothetical protein
MKSYYVATPEQRFEVRQHIKELESEIQNLRNALERAEPFREFKEFVLRTIADWLLSTMILCMLAMPILLTWLLIAWAWAQITGGGIVRMW